MRIFKTLNWFTQGFQEFPGHGSFRIASGLERPHLYNPPRTGMPFRSSTLRGRSYPGQMHYVLICLVTNLTISNFQIVIYIPRQLRRRHSVYAIYRKYFIMRPLAFATQKPSNGSQTRESSLMEKLCPLRSFDPVHCNIAVRM